MTQRVKITGYINLEPDEEDPESATGMTEEAYMNQAMNEDGFGWRVADLDDLDVTKV